MKTKLFLLFIVLMAIFAYFSYTVAKHHWQKIDFDTTVKLQDHISRKYDGLFSYFSLLGSAEVTTVICLIFAVLALLKHRWGAILGWLMIIVATFGEIFGKLVLFHPAPPVFFHRSLLPTSLPSFYVHTDYSYPSGHMARTVFIITILFWLMIFSKKDWAVRLTVIALFVWLIFLMSLTRVYLGEHWLSDVLGGSLLGAGIGCLASIFILSNNRRIDFKVGKK